MLPEMEILRQVEGYPGASGYIIPYEGCEGGLVDGRGGEVRQRRSENIGYLATQKAQQDRSSANLEIAIVVAANGSGSTIVERQDQVEEG